MLKTLFLFTAALSLVSCANVKQIDRDLLSKKIMSFDPHPEESYFRNEVRSYREGAVGGTQAVGGGCGCN